MSRVIGAVVRTTNYELNARKPLDARSLVPTYQDLTHRDNWFDGTKIIAYNGMLVAVANTTDTSKNGLYMLFDVNCTSALKSPDVTSENNWIKIGETSDIADITSRVAKIETDLLSITDTLSDLDARITALEGESDVVTYGYRSGFPSEGETGKLYVAADEGKTYVWYNNMYLSVGGSSEAVQPDVIFGGTAD